MPRRAVGQGRAARRLVLVWACVLAAACPRPEPEPPAEPVEPPPAPEPAPPPEPEPPPAALRLEISLSARELYVYLDDELVQTHRVAIGQPGHETPTGQFRIHRVDWNPDWTPPDSEWAEDEEYRPPGHPDNPMGRARLVFQAPYTIHGTSDVESLGQAVSRGSVRVANTVVMDLGRLVMEHGGAPRAPAWFDDVIATPTEMVQVSIPNPIRLSIRE